MNRARADMEQTVAAVQKAAEERVHSGVTNSQHAAEQTHHRLAEERRLREESLARETEAKQRLAEEKRAAWARLEEERRKLEEERRKNIELVGQVDTLTAQVEFIRSSSRASAEAEDAQMRATEEMDERSRRREKELEEIGQKERAVQAMDAAVSSRLRACEAREDAAQAAETRARAEAETAAARLKQVEQTLALAKAVQVDSAKAAQAADNVSAARVAASNEELKGVLEVFDRTKQSMAVAAEESEQAKQRATEQATEASARADRMHTQMAQLEDACQRRIKVAEALSADLREQNRTLKLSKDDETEANKAAAKQMLEAAQHAVSSTKASQEEVEQHVKDEVARAKAMVSKAQLKAQAAVQEAERNAAERVAAASAQLEQTGALLATMKTEVKSLREAGTQPIDETERLKKRVQDLEAERANFEQVANVIADQQEELRADMATKQAQLERSNAHVSRHATVPLLGFFWHVFLRECLCFQLETANTLVNQLAEDRPTAETDQLKKDCAALQGELAKERARGAELQLQNEVANCNICAYLFGNFRLKMQK